MADEKGAGEGGALLKRIKITKAQRTMFIFVCGASIILGVTAVLGIYFTKTIIFDNKLIKQKDIVINSLKQSQDSLSGMSAQIDALTSNEYLESVSTERSLVFNCEDYSSSSAFSEFKTKEEVEKARRCSSLRVISDAMPSTSAVTASGTQAVTLDDVRSTTQVQIDLIMDKAQLDSDDDENGTSIDDAGQSNSSELSSLIEPYSMLNIGINASGSLDKMKSFLSTIDKSVRNFDLRSATFEITDGNNLQFNGEYYAYYTNPVNLQIMKRTVCADTESDECVAAGGDQSIKTDK
jgi:hypothetical protein